MEILKIDIDKLSEFVQGFWILSELHGINHWRRVYRNGCLLYTEGVNMNVVAAFAFLHDSARQDDGMDINHGIRAVDNVIKLRDTLLVNLTEEEIFLLCEACRLHTIMHKIGNITIDTCFDADRLDLDRCGIVPDPFRMATPKGVEYAKKFTEYRKLRDME